VHLYIDSKTTDSTLEAGTAVYPFSNIVYAFQEVFNFQKFYSTLKIIIHLQEGDHKVYSGKLPLLIANSNITVIPWGEESKVKVTILRRDQDVQT
jgi:hypothetical protein